MTTHFINRIKNTNKSHLEQTGFWVFMFLFVFDYHFEINNWAEAAGTTIAELCTYAVLVYINLFTLIPYVLNKSKSLYILAILANIGLYIFLIKAIGLEPSLYDKIGWRSMFSMALNATLFLFISFLYWYFKQWYFEREKQIILSGEKTEAELKFLKTQISPHFVFNTLNNIYALALTSHTNTAPMVAKLSGILRYVLYEASAQKVLLKNEWDMVKQYIDLFLLKKPKSQNIDTYLEGTLANYCIAPMLLVNLVENVLKHSGLENNVEAWAKINLELVDGGKMIFTTENTIATENENTDDGGIGLQNLRRQLDISYPNNYNLELINQDALFQVKLQIQLTKI